MHYSTAVCWRNELETQVTLPRCGRQRYCLSLLCCAMSDDDWLLLSDAYKLAAHHKVENLGPFTAASLQVMDDLLNDQWLFALHTTSTAQARADLSDCMIRFQCSTQNGTPSHLQSNRSSHASIVTSLVKGLLFTTPNLTTQRHYKSFSVVYCKVC